MSGKKKGGKEMNRGRRGRMEERKRDRETAVEEKGKGRGIEAHEEVWNEGDKKKLREQGGLYGWGRRREKGER